jgi:hypothetical protein
MTFETPEQGAFPSYYQPETSDGGDADSSGSEPELPPDDAIDEAAMTAPDGWGEEEGTDSPPLAGGGDTGDNDPPTDISAEISDHESEPERGESLKRVFDYTAVANDLVDQEADDRGIVPSEPTPSDTVQELIDSGMTLEEALRVLRSEAAANSDSRRSLIGEELNVTNVQYGEDLEQAGLRLIEGFERIDLDVTDIDAYITALDNRPEITDDETKARFDHETVRTTKGAMIRVAYGKIHEGHDHIQEEDPLARQLPERAERLAETLTRIEAPKTIIEAAEIMATAHRDGMDKEWAEGFDMWLFGAHDIPMGTDRYGEQEDWDKANTYLDKLAREAPDTQFTRDVYATVLRDADQALERQQASPAGSIDVHTPQDSPEYTEAMRSAVLGIAAPTIRQNIARIAEVARQLDRRRQG